MALTRAASARCFARGTGERARWTSFSAASPDAYMGELSDRDLADFEALMEVPDRDLFAWVTGQEPVAANYNSQVYAAIVRYHAGAPKSR
jgi:hypothetical protein